MAAINAVVTFILEVERSNERLMLRVEVRELFLRRRDFIEGLRAYRFLECDSKKVGNRSRE